MNVSEKMMWSTYSLATEKGAATGFVVTHHVAHAATGVEPVVFTSSHVLETLGKGPFVIGLHMPVEEGYAQEVLLVFTPPKTAGKRFYVRHPHQDIAAFAMHLPPELAGIAEMPSFLKERMLKHKAKSLHSGKEVEFLGYPDVFPGTDGGFPVLRSGRVASYPVGTAQAHGRFLINSDVYPGDSGAPVFLAADRGGDPQLMGMIIQRVGPETRSFSHLAIAVDVDVIRETLDILAESERQPVQVRKQVNTLTTASSQ